LRAFGITPDAPTPVEVYAHNGLALQVWADVWNQWRWISGMVTMRIGLDWTQVEAVMRMRAIPRGEHMSLLSALRIMESEALAALAKQE
jgi:hypothetical protein